MMGPLRAELDDVDAVSAGGAVVGGAAVPRIVVTDSAVTAPGLVSPRFLNTPSIWGRIHGFLVRVFTVTTNDRRFSLIFTRRAVLQGWLYGDRLPRHELFTNVFENRRD